MNKPIFKYYQTPLGKLNIKNDFPDIIGNISNMLTQTKNHLFEMDKIIYSDIDSQFLKDSYNVNKNNKQRKFTNKDNKHRSSLQKITLRSRKQLNKNTIKENSMKPFSNNKLTEQYSFHKPKTRNNPKCFFNTQNTYTNNGTDTSSFLKTSLNQSSINTTAVTIKRQFPNLYLFKKTKEKFLPALDKSIFNKTNEQTSHFDNTDIISTEPFTPFELAYCQKQNNNNISYSPNTITRKCMTIEKDSIDIGKRVKNAPIKIIYNKQVAIDQLNKSNATIEDITGSKEKKPINPEDLMKVSTKTQRILAETKCIQNTSPFLAYTANRTVRDIFSIRTQEQDTKKYDKLIKSFKMKTNQMNTLVKKTTEANKLLNKRLEKYTKKLKLKKIPSKGKLW